MYYRLLFVLSMTGIVSSMVTGCIATAPVSFAWRSNSTQQYATTEGKTDSKSEGASVNAEKTSTLDNNVNTGTQEGEKPERRFEYGQSEPRK